MKRSSLLPTIVVLALLIGPACVAAEITDERAIQSANITFVGEERASPEWVFYLDKKLERWQWLKARWQECSVKDRKLGREDLVCGPDLAQMESALARRKVWAVVYKRVLTPGDHGFHSNAMVMVDADSGKVLAIIAQKGKC